MNISTRSRIGCVHVCVRVEPQQPYVVFLGSQRHADSRQSPYSDGVVTAKDYRSSAFAHERADPG